MRSTKERIYQALSFEIIALFFAIPIGILLFKLPLEKVGVVTIIGATIATIWVYIYNRIFDKMLKKKTEQLNKTIKIRVLHALLFETGLLIILLPFIAWYLKISIVDALIMDIAFAIFYVIYAFIFNWLYDILRPANEKHS